MKLHRLMISAIILSSLLGLQSLQASSIQRLGDNAQIDWTALYYTATGEGAMPSSKEEPHRGKAYLKAKGYARMAAIANLLAAIEGTTISMHATGKDYMEDAVIRQRIEGFVRNVEVVSERKENVGGDTIVIVTVRAPMFSQKGPGSVILEKEILDQPSDDSKVRVALKPDSKAKLGNRPSAKASSPGMPYTSVIIDTTGYKLDRCMSPKIRRPNGDEVWGTVQCDRDLVIERGIASYCTSLAEAKKNQRCGANPLVIYAVGRAGGRFNSDPVISDADANLLMEENLKSGFLNKLNVIIVKDGKL